MITFIVPAISVAVRDIVANTETPITIRARFLATQGFSTAEISRILTAHSGETVVYQRVRAALKVADRD